MKKILSIIAIAFLLVLAACSQEVKSNARANVSNYVPSTKSVTLRVEVKDPDEELDSRIFDIMVIDSNDKQTELKDIKIEKNQSKTVTIENLERVTEYTVVVKGLKNSEVIELARVKNAFKTLNVGEVESDPILIETTKAFMEMNKEPKKHYKLANDLDFTGVEFEPVFGSGTAFTGSFDGNNKTIKNITMNDETNASKMYLSVFGYVSKSKIKNVVFDNIVIDTTAKPSNNIQYVGLVVSRVSNNEFQLENVTVMNSSLTVLHNTNKITQNRSLYVGLVGGFVQGKLSNITVKDSTLDVTQGGVNGYYQDKDFSKTGTFIGGAFGLVEQDKGFGINEILVFNTDINVEIAQDKSSHGSGSLNIGGIFGYNGTDRGATNLVSNASINLSYTFDEGTTDKTADIVYLGGIAGNFPRSGIENAYFGGEIVVTSSNDLKVLNVAMITAVTSKSSEKVLGNGTISVNVENTITKTVLADIYNYQSLGNWEKFDHVKRLANASATVNNQTVSFEDYELITEITDFITSQFILDNYNK